jgi:phenylcoumaran benzylic ether reductase
MSLTLQGDINDHETLVKAIKQVDIVICAAGRLLIEDQVKIIKAIKEAGNVKVNKFVTTPVNKFK